MLELLVSLESGYQPNSESLQELPPEFAEVLLDSNLQSSWLKLSYFNFIYGVELLFDFSEMGETNHLGELQFELEGKYTKLILSCFDDANQLLEFHTNLFPSPMVQAKCKYEPELTEMIEQIQCDFKPELALIKSLAAAKVELTKVVTEKTVTQSTIDRFGLMVRLLQENQFPQYMPFFSQLLNFIGTTEIYDTSQGIESDCDTELIGKQLDRLYMATTRVMDEYFFQQREGVFRSSF